MQAEVENLTLEEHRLDEQIRFGCYAFAYSAFLCCLFAIYSTSLSFKLPQGDARKTGGP